MSRDVVLACRDYADKSGSLHSYILFLEVEILYHYWLAGEVN